MSQRTPSELLASLLLGNRDGVQEAAGEISRRSLWVNSVRLAFAWRCVPRLRVRVAEIAGMPEDARMVLSSYAAAAAAQSAMVCRGAATAIAALESASVKCAAFKGLGMIGAVYRAPADRMLQDADILIEATDFHKAAEALKGAGFEPAITIDLEAWHRLLEERVYPTHDYLDFVNADGARIDLHWRLAAGDAFSIGGILERGVDAVVSRQRIRVVSAEDAMVLTANHLVRDRLAPASAAKDLIDLDAWINFASDRWRVDDLSTRATDAGFSVSLLASLRILSHYDQQGNARTVFEGVERTCARTESIAAQQLADLFFLQLARGNVSALVVGMAGFTPALAGRFIISRLRSLASATYRRNKFSGAASPLFTDEVRVFARDVLTLTPERFRKYRALARETRSQVE